MVCQSITAVGNVQEEADSMQAYGAVFWPQTLYKPHWHAALDALKDCTALEPSLASIDWVNLKEEVSNSNIHAPKSHDYQTWIGSFRQSTDVVSYSVMFLENAINDLFKGGNFFRSLDQQKLAKNFLSLKDPRRNDYFSAVIGIQEDRRLWLLAQPTGTLLKLLGDEISAALNQPGIGDIGSAIDYVNSTDRGTSPVQKIKRLKAILNGFANFGFPHEGDIEKIVRLRNLLKHGKAVLDIAAFSNPALPATTLASIKSQSPDHEQEHEAAVEMLSTWISPILITKRPIEVFPYGWVGKDLSEHVISRVKEYCAKLDKLTSDSQLPHTPERVSFSHLFAPAQTPWP
jgi:hypothetical protein